MLIEAKIKTSPYKIGIAFGQVLGYRILMAKPETKIGLAFFNDPHSSYKWYRWEKMQENLVRILAKNLEEKIIIFLVKRDGLVEMI